MKISNLAWSDRFWTRTQFSHLPLLGMLKGIGKIEPGKKQTQEDTMHMILTPQGWEKEFL